jgi:hypothetical protein
VNAALPLMLHMHGAAMNARLQVCMYLSAEGCPAVAAAYECMVLQANACAYNWICT